MTEEQAQLLRIPETVRRLYEVVDELSDLSPGRPFTPDGHLVESLGGVIAAHLFDLNLEPPSREGFDARTRDGRSVEVKLTQGKRVLLSDLDGVPDLLVVLYLAREQPVTVVFSGPADVARRRVLLPVARVVVPALFSASEERDVRRRDVVVGGLALSVTAPWVLAACGDDGDGGDAGDDAGATGAELLDGLAADGGAVFEHLYGSTNSGGSALVVGTAGARAVAYLCDPAGPAHWFNGSIDGDVVSLSSDDGASLTGTVTGGTIACALTGTDGNDGERRVEERTDITLSRQVDAEQGNPVGGLIVDGSVATGSFTVGIPAPTSLGATTTTVSNLATTVGSVGIGLRVSAGSTVDIALTITAPRSFTSAQSAAIRDSLVAKQAEIQRLAQRTAEAVRVAEEKSTCAKVVSVVAAVILVAIAIVVAVFTFGAAGALVALAVIAAAAIIGSQIDSVDEAATELGALVGASIGASLVAFIEVNDMTEGQLILQTVRQATTRTTTSSTTTTTAARPFPNAGQVSLLLR